MRDFVHRLSVWIMESIGLRPMPGILILCIDETDAYVVAKSIGATVTNDPDRMMDCIYNGVHVAMPMNITPDLSLPFDLNVTVSLQMFSNENRQLKPRYIN